MPRRDQGLAVTAWQLLEQARDQLGRRERREFRTRAMGLGPMLHTCGLAATAAFLAAKAGGGDDLAPAYSRMADALAAHVTTSVGAAPLDRNAFVSWLGQADPPTYRLAGAAAREFGLWVRRAAEALLPAPRSEPEPQPATGGDGGEPAPGTLP